MDVFIYALIDPINGDVRYIGKTIDLKVRFRLHLNQTWKNIHKNNWIKALLAQGKEPIMEVIETIPNSDDTDWQIRETHWIQFYRALGSPLTNLDTGGIGGKKRSEETKLKIGLSQKGKRLSDRHIQFLKERSISPETRMRLSAANKGRLVSLELAALRGAAQKGLKRSDEFKEKQRLAGLNRRHSAETIAKMKDLHANRDPAINAKISATKTGVKDSPETREKKRLMRIGKKHSPETIQRMREAAARRKALTASQVSAEPAI
jgi:group I intron endonuclease